MDVDNFHNFAVQHYRYDRTLTLASPQAPANMSPDFDTSVKLYLYRTIAATARIPRKIEVAKEFSEEATTIDGVFRRLREKKLVALAPDTGEIVMAPPFSATPTGFNVHIDGSTYFANCVWDAYGIAAALHHDAEISAGCGCCGEPMRMAVSGGKPVPTPGLAHFAVPARHWWDNITFT